MKVFVVVENYGLINNDAYVFGTMREAEAKYKEVTGVEYKTALKYFKEEKRGIAGWWKKFSDSTVDALRDKEFEQTKIYEIKFVPNEDELFHIVHSAIWNINENRATQNVIDPTQNIMSKIYNKLVVLDREIGEAVKHLQEE